MSNHKMQKYKTGPTAPAKGTIRLRELLPVGAKGNSMPCQSFS